MKYKHYILSVFALLCLSVIAKAQNELSGRILNGKDTKLVSGVSVYIEDLKVGAISDKDGNYSIKHLPKGNFVITVHSIGFADKAQSVEINGVTSLDVTIMPASYEEQGVVITGNAIATEIENTPQPITEVPNSYLMQNASTNIIDAISKIPGVSGITDGQSISKPVIRGLGYNRVVTINDGVRQEGQQWGDEFGIEVDPNSVDRVEVLKGPASLVYGSDAISGVVNLLPERTLPEGEIKGDVLMNYQTNNGLINTAGHVAGNINGITFSARVDNTMAHAYKDKADGYVLNSQFNNFNTDETIGIHKKWGFSQLHYSHFELRTGIVEGAKDSSGAFLIQTIDDNGEPSDRVATNQELKSYTPFLINQLVKHDKLVWDNSISLGGSRIIARLAWQQNSRQENNDITMPNTSNIWYQLNTYNYDLRYVSPDMHGFDFSAGVNGMYQDSKNKGTLLLIPEYNLFDLGAFAIANKKIGNLTISGGVRYDTRQFKGHDDYIDSNGNQLQANDPAAIHRFVAYNSNFNGVSASLGATYKITNTVYVKANAARGFRAPNVAESGSNGIHDGTVIYEIGQPNLKPENNLEFDFAPGIRSKDVTAEVDLFYNSIHNFIYAKQLNSAFGGDSVNNSTPGFTDASIFLYSQTNATLMGLEAMVDIHPSGLKWFDWYTAFSTVNAHLQNVPDSEKYLPFTPPARLRSEITASFPKLCKSFNNTYIRVGVLHSFEQSNVYAQANRYQGVPDAVPSTPAYTLLNAGIGTDILSRGRKAMSLYISMDNIANVNYTDYMSRFKY
jgi:iron complex outermembrane receptor protein